MGGKKKYLNIFGSFTEPFNYITVSDESSPDKNPLCRTTTQWRAY